MIGNIFLTSFVLMVLLLTIIFIFDYDEVPRFFSAVVVCSLFVSIAAAVISLIAMIWS
mgnify:CR=1 FL=1